MCRQAGNGCSHLRLLMNQEPCHRPAEARVRDPMGALRHHRQVTALKLMLTLRTPFDPGEVVSNSELDGAIVAGLEVQEPEAVIAAPIASVEGVGAENVEGAGYRPAGGR